ncbi:MAG: bacterial transcriptional activator domain-containing protein [Ktedonobacteraceae bacterium]
MKDDEDSAVLVRVWLYGLFLVEYRNEDGNWIPIEKTVWDKHPYARLLLQRLLCSGGRRVERSTLIDDLWPHSEGSESVERYPSDAAYQLRKMPGFRSIVKTFGSTSGYALAHQSQVWVDVDESEALLRAVERVGRTSAEAVTLLKQAEMLFQRGGFLEGQAGHWCLAKRATTERMHYRCSRWLAEAYEQQGQVGQAEMHYSQLLEDDPTDEDVLCHLVRLLHQQGMTRQALRCYEQTKQHVSQSGYRLSAATEKTITQLVSQPRSRDVFAPIHDLESDETVNRREATKHIGMLGLTLFAAPYRLLDTLKIQNDSIEEYISSCEENILACWRLMKGNEITVVPSVLCTWLPSLESLARQPAPYQKQSAALTVQAYLIAGLVTVLRRDYQGSEWCCKQAIKYSEIAQDNNLKIAALKHLATKYNDAGYYLKTLQTYQGALLCIERVSPLLQSRIHLGLTLSYAQCQKNREALRHWELAQESFPEYPEHDPSFVYADCGKSSLNHYAGLMYLEFGQPEKAWEVFQEVVQLQQQTSIPERTIIEIVNCKVEAAIAQKKLELACIHLQEGIQGAIKLKSEMRFHDSVRLYQKARAIWPHEQTLGELEELFH